MRLVRDRADAADFLSVLGLGDQTPTKLGTGGGRGLDVAIE